MIVGRFTLSGCTGLRTGLFASRAPHWRVPMSCTGLGYSRNGLPCKLFSSSADANKPILTLFTKEGCTLCDVAMSTLEETIPDGAYTLHTVDILSAGNETWKSRYQYDIPVFHLNGQFLMKHKADVELLAAELVKLQP